MKAERFSIQSCCGNTSLIFKTDRPILLTDIKKLVGMGFIESAHFTKAGILYVDNQDLIVTGPIGSNRLQVKCKIRDTQSNNNRCTQKVNDFEVLIQQLG